MEKIYVSCTRGVEKLLEGLKPGKSCGPDGLHPRILKELSRELAEPLANLFQQSLDQGYLPSDWKSANICPLYKKGDRGVPSNYRPVSITSIPCKLLEHIVASELMGHVELYNLLSPAQHAFRKRHSCETQLLLTANDWAKAIDEGKQTDMFIMDFEKAFDTPPHELITAKLRSFGASVQVMNWVHDFLVGRSQSVVVNGAKSSAKNVGSGVPQGSVMGPILFSLYINDLANNTKSTVRLFADDCVCYRTVKSDKDRHELQQDIDNIAEWARTWSMRFQPTKCNTMAITNKKKPISNNYTLEGVKMDPVDQIKYLGVTISKDMNWTKHITNTCNKANSVLGLLKRNLNNCDQKVKQRAYEGLVRPTLEYASTVWDPHTIKLKDQIEKVQKSAGRFITGNYTHEHGQSSIIRQELDWKTLVDRRKDNRLIMYYKAMKQQATVPPVRQLSKQSHTSNRTHEYYRRPLPVRTNVYRYSFIPRTLVDMNAINPTLIRRAEMGALSTHITTFSSTIRATV